MLVGWKSGRKAFSNPKQNTGEDWCLGLFVFFFFVFLFFTPLGYSALA